MTERHDGDLPLISVIVPVFNGENYLQHALQSILSQDYACIEVVVVDDGSNNPEAIREICEKCHDHRVRLIRKENGGVSSALNLGIAHAHGSLFAWLSHDDLFLPGKLLHQTSLWQLRGSNPKCIIFSNYNLIDGQGRTTSYRRLERELNRSTSRLTPMTRGLVNGCTILMDLNALRELGPFDESLRCTQDFDMWLRAANCGFDFCFDAQPTVATRIHAEQTSQTAPSVASENAKIWLRLARAVITDSMPTAASQLREVNRFIEFVTHAQYLADCDLSETVALLRQEACYLRTSTPRNMVFKELLRHRFAIAQLKLKRRAQASRLLRECKRLLVCARGRF